MKVVSAAAIGLQILATGLLGLMAGFFLAVSADLTPAMLALDAQNHPSARQAMQRVGKQFPFAMVYYAEVPERFVVSTRAQTRVLLENQRP